MTDVISLTLPSDPGLRGVATLVLGGIGTRLDLSYERMDDLQLALLSALEACDGGELHVDVEAGTSDVVVAVRPLRVDSAHDVGLRRVLDPLVDEVVFSEPNDGAELRLRLNR